MTKTSPIVLLVYDNRMTKHVQFSTTFRHFSTSSGEELNVTFLNGKTQLFKMRIQLRARHKGVT